MSTTTFTPPYARSWVDRMFDWIERLPGPIWLFHAGVFGVCIIVGIWFEAPNYPGTPGWLFTSISGFLLSGTHWLRFSAADALHETRPALDLTDAEAESLAYRFAITPAKWAWGFLLFEIVYLPLYVMSDAEPFGYRTLPLSVLIPGLIAWAFGETIGWAAIFMTIRRLIMVSRVRRNLASVELFRQQPLHAFSKLTFRSALMLLFLFGYIPLLTLGSEAFTDPLYLGTLVIGGAGAIVVAVLPLVGTHNAIADEKRRRAMANGHLIEQTLGAMDTAVVKGDTATLDAAQKSLTALLTQRDLIAKAPTWPWTPGTVRTFATTVMLPILFLFAGRAADRWFG